MGVAKLQGYTLSRQHSLKWCRGHRLTGFWNMDSKGLWSVWWWLCIQMCRCGVSHKQIEQWGVLLCWSSLPFEWVTGWGLPCWIRTVPRPLSKASASVTAGLFESNCVSCRGHAIACLVLSALKLPLHNTSPHEMDILLQEITHHVGLLGQSWGWRQT